MSAGLAVIIVVAASVVTCVVAPWFLARQDDSRGRLRARLKYATASRRYWQERAAHAEAELSRAESDAWPLYRSSCRGHQSGDPSPLPGHPVKDGAGYDCQCGACDPGDRG